MQQLLAVEKAGRRLNRCRRMMPPCWMQEHLERCYTNPLRCPEALRHHPPRRTAAFRFAEHPWLVQLFADCQRLLTSTECPGLARAGPSAIFPVMRLSQAESTMLMHVLA